MMMAMCFKIVVFVPLSHADAVRQALGDAGSGRIGNYTHCSFSSRGVGRFFGDEGAKPQIGAAVRIEAVEEERIEVTVARDDLPVVIAAMKAVHPFEEVAFDGYPLKTFVLG